MIKPAHIAKLSIDESRPIYIGDTLRKPVSARVTGESVEFLGEEYYRILHYDRMEPFFISLISSSDHWLFISSTGGLSAGRESAEWALFPYSTDDKITENASNTGSKTIFLVTREDFTSLWEPFSSSCAGCYSLTRAIYKNTSGTSVVFEETNHTLGLRYRYAWRTGEEFGFVKTAWLANLGEVGCHIELIDGFQNVLPANVPSQMQNVFSNLLDAYKRSELVAETGLGIFTLSSVLSDLAEPSESLLATTAAQVGLEQVDYLLSSVQLNAFRQGSGVVPEEDVRGRRGAYFAHSLLYLLSGGEKSWHFIADVRKDHAAVLLLNEYLKEPANAVCQAIEADLEANRRKLEGLVALSDGFQVSRESAISGHHFANVMFNIMRGGIFPDQYRIQKADFLAFLQKRNTGVYSKAEGVFAGFQDTFDLSDLHELARSTADPDLARLCYAYLPLIFSRRHGDPSRPWNRFSISLKNPDGSRKLGYEGNWRDIFQNWEALAYSYPEYVGNMISTFLNATTVDGYNPYRITNEGIDWERPEHDNPWSNIGYWSDHQIIYLQKLMEVSEKVSPGTLAKRLHEPLFSYANVPYKIKSYADLIRDPYKTIAFDWAMDEEIERLVGEIGADARLVRKPGGDVFHANLTEKLLTLLLAKLVNFVPDGGIWMNTQRPEWNDANNALVGKGISVVTLAYLRRFVQFFSGLIAGQADFQISEELLSLFGSMADILAGYRSQAGQRFTPELRREMLDDLGEAGSAFREHCYQNGLSGHTQSLPAADLASFLDVTIETIDATLRANRRDDGLFHSYNILKLGERDANVQALYEMLEGQVAVLSSGLLSAEESVHLLRALKNSALYREDQNTYILYPDRELPGFLEKNTLSPEQVNGLNLVETMVSNGDHRLFSKNLHGGYHFNPSFRNIRDVNRVLANLSDSRHYDPITEAEAPAIRRLFEKTFAHDRFTGRSGTFFAYEGLGSIYWHMVSKLLLAVQETASQYRHTAYGKELAGFYREIRSGLGYKKTPDLYGAFPVDPYSHTPKGRGAKQPGMTGLVKEEILTRLVEVGASVENGALVFDTWLLDRDEMVREPVVFVYRDVEGREKELVLEAGSLAYTFCQVPVVVRTARKNRVSIFYRNGFVREVSGHRLDAETSRHIFVRDGTIESLVVDIK